MHFFCEIGIEISIDDSYLISHDYEDNSVIITNTLSNISL